MIAVIVAVEREKNVEAITWRNIGREGNMRFSLMITDVVRVNSQKKIVSLEQLTQELKMERKDFLMTGEGLREIPIKSLLDKALKPYREKGESFSTRLPMDWKELTYRVTGKKEDDCNACNTGTPLEIEFKWDHENLLVAKVGKLSRK